MTTSQFLLLLSAFHLMPFIAIAAALFFASVWDYARNFPGEDR